MTPQEIELILVALTQAIPAVAALFTKATSGGTVTGTDLQAALSKYGVDQAVFTAAIAAAKAAGK